MISANMGRSYHQKKMTVEECLDIDVFWLKENGFFGGYKRSIVEWSGGWNSKKNSIEIFVDTEDFPGYIRFKYEVSDSISYSKKKYDYVVSFTRTACNYGGYRYWLLCPIIKSDQQCGKRVAKLYMARYNYFGCRSCLDLTYKSRNKTRSGYIGYLSMLYEVDQRINRLLQDMKITHRKGIPTKKYRQLQNMYELLSGLGEEDYINRMNDFLQNNK